MNKKFLSEKGVLSVEASIALSVLLFFVFSMMDFGTVFRAQNYMVHGAVQTAKALSYKSYEYKTITAGSTEIALSLFSELFSGVTGKTEEQDLKLMWGIEGIEECTELVFYNTAGANRESVENSMKRYGIEDVSFKSTEKTDEDLIINISYKVKLKYPFFGFSEVTLRQQAKSRLW